jgi:flagellar biosynthesis/type III secretory pathway protein FliH
MLLSGWNWEDAKAVWREEGYEEGFREGYEEGFREGYEEGFREGYEEGRKERREEVLALIAAGCGIEEIQARLMVERRG